MKPLPDFVKLPENEGMVDVPFDMLIEANAETIEKYFEDDSRKLSLNKMYDEVTSKVYNTAAVDNFLEAQRNIDKKLKSKIEPNPITDMNSAGWLAPNGEWYGLDGEIANMLHNQIADALVEAGIIPDGEGNPDGWMAAKGWARIHCRNVLFEGYAQEKYGIGKKVSITKKQIKALIEYGNGFTDGPYLSLGINGMGWLQSHQVSTAKLGWLTDKELEKYFDF